MTLSSELQNLRLFAAALWKLSYTTGFLPFVVCAFIGRHKGRFWSPIAIGHAYRVLRYHTGVFIGRVDFVDRDVARLTVIDPLRPMPKIANRCSFPECIREDFHAGDHEFSRVRQGATVEVFWRNAKFEHYGKGAA